jgi:hypothetical protein
MTNPVADKPGFRDLIQTSLPNESVMATVDGLRAPDDRDQAFRLIATRRSD